MFVLYFLYLYKVKNTHLLKSIFMEIPKYYKDTCNAYNRVYHVISLEEYKAKMFADNWKSHATLTPLAKQDGPLWLQYD